MTRKFYDLKIGQMALVAADLNARMSLTRLTAAVANNMLSQITTTGLYLSIHTGDPSNTGANEIVGSGMIGYSSGGYTGSRMAIAWAAASSGVVVSNTTQTYPLLATQAGGIPYFGLWTDTGASGHAGTFLFGGATSNLSGSIPNGANVVFTNGVTLTVSG